MKIITLATLFATSLFGATINDTCPYSGKPVKEGLTYEISVCCNKCVKKAMADIKKTLQRVKDPAICPFSGRKGTKKLVIGVCCNNCLKKAKNQGK